MGETVIESCTIPGMAHGAPLGTQGDALGTPGPFFLDVGLSSSVHIARFWGLIGEPVSEGPEAGASPALADPGERSGLGALIRKALRAVGLLKS